MAITISNPQMPLETVSHQPRKRTLPERCAAKLSDWFYVASVHLSCYERGHEWDGWGECAKCGKPMEDFDPKRQ